MSLGEGARPCPEGQSSDGPAGLAFVPLGKGTDRVAGYALVLPGQGGPGGLTSFLVGAKGQRSEGCSRPHNQRQLTRDSFTLHKGPKHWCAGPCGVLPLGAEDTGEFRAGGRCLCRGPSLCPRSGPGAGLPHGLQGHRRAQGDGASLSGKRKAAALVRAQLARH